MAYSTYINDLLSYNLSPFHYGSQTAHRSSSIQVFGMSQADKDVIVSRDDDEDVESPQEKPKAKKSKKDSAGSSTKKTMSSRASLCFPVPRIRKQLKAGGYAKRVQRGGAVFMTAVIEYITAEILELAGNSAKEQKKNRIIPRHVQLAIRQDEELNKYMSNVTIQGGGVIPNIHQVLIPQKEGQQKDAGAGGSFSQEY